MPPARVLIVDDSPTQRLILTRLIESAADLVVIGQAGDGIDAVEKVALLRPDVISMDLKMPRLDGLGATRQIMNRWPTPIVVVSSAGKSSAAMELLEAGALAAVEKLPAPTDPRYRAHCDELLMMLRLMAGVRVIRHWNPDGLGTRPLSAPPDPAAPPTPIPLIRFDSRQAPAIVGIGASAGGPGALAKLIGGLPADFPLPVLIVQHLSAEFVPGLAEWLNRTCPLPVRLAIAGETPQPGVIYIAPGNTHLGVSADRRLVLDSRPGLYRHCPAVDALFGSLAEVYGSRAVGVVLTGMGDDGAEGLRGLRTFGARTIAQDADSCVVFGMPAAAIARGGVEFTLPLTAISTAILTLIGYKAAHIPVLVPPNDRSSERGSGRSST